MNRRYLGVHVAVILASGVVAAAASPASGASRTDHVRATISAPISASATGESDVAGQLVSLPPGGAIPWHSHPGANFVAVKGGALDGLRRRRRRLHHDRLPGRRGVPGARRDGALGQERGAGTG